MCMSEQCLVHVNCTRVMLIRTCRKEGTKHGGELDLGAVDSTHYTGQIYYEQVIQKAYWEIEMDS